MDISLLNLFTPTPGQSFDVLTASSLVAPSLSLTGDPGFSFEIVTGDTLRLNFSSASLQGDFNGNGIVDAADFTVWFDNLGASENGSVLKGNGNGGTVDQTDYVLWKNSFGNTGVGSVNVAVPEPSTFLLLGVLTTLLVSVRWTTTGRYYRGAHIGPSLPCCLVTALFATFATETAHATFTIDGETFTEMFADDFSGIGVSEGDAGNPGTFLTDNGNGLDVSKWTWNMRRAARIERDGGGTVLVQSHDGFPSGGSGDDDVIVATRGGQLSALTSASQWGYEVAFSVNSQPVGSLSSATGSAGILIGKTESGANDDPAAVRDVSVVVREGSNGLKFDLFHSTGLFLTAGGTLTRLATDLDRDQEYVLGIHHVALDQVNYYLDGTFVGTLGSTNIAPPEVILLGDNSGLTHADLSFNSYKVGTTTGGPPTTEFFWFTDSSANFNSPINWMFGVPNTNERTAVFGDVITADRSVLNAVAVTVKGVRFDNANSYVITGPGSIHLDADTGNVAIDVLQGSHEFQQDVLLQDATDVDVAGGAVLNFSNELNLNGMTLTKTGMGALNVNNALTGGGTLDCQAGSCGGAGTLIGELVNSGGTVSPGNSPGVLEVQGDYRQSEHATLLIELGGDGLGAEYDQLAVTGAVELGGELVVTLTSGFEPEVGDRFDILTWQEVTGSFDQVDLPTLPIGMMWDSSQLYATGTGSLAVTAVPEPSVYVLSVMGILYVLCSRIDILNAFRSCR